MRHLSQTWNRATLQSNQELLDSENRRRMRQAIRLRRLRAQIDWLVTEVAKSRNTQGGSL